MMLGYRKVILKKFISSPSQQDEGKNDNKNFFFSLLRELYALLVFSTVVGLQTGFFITDNEKSILIWVTL